MQEPRLVIEDAQRPPVIIVGAGPTGLATANLLGLAGVETIVLERSAGLSSYPRAISIDDEGLRVCQALGLLDEILADVLLDVPVRYLSGRQVLARVAPEQQRHGFPLFSVFYQPALEASLLQGLARFPHVRCYFEHTVEQVTQDDQQAWLDVRTPRGELVRLTCDYLLACDGGKSAIRQQAGIEMLGRSAPQKWLVLDCEQDQAAERIIQFFCNPRRPAVSLPAPGQRRRWEFMLMPGESEQDLLDPGRIQALVHLYEPGAGIRITRQVIYTFHALRAERLSRGRIFLLGDAAHLMPPFGGQGMNSGLRDAHNLSWKIVLAVRGLALPRLLESYHAERAEHVDQMIRFSTLLGRIIMPTAPALAWLRDLLLGGLNLAPPIRALIKEAGIKPAPRYKDALRLSRRLPGQKNRREQALIGQMLPQPLVLNQAGTVERLDELLGSGFALLRFTSDASAAFAGWDEACWEGVLIRRVCILPGKKAVGILQDADPGVALAGDIQGGLGRFVQQRHDIYLLVRPDRYILDVFPVSELAAFQRACKNRPGSEKTFRDNLE